MTSTGLVSRRAFLRIGLGAGGGLLVGIALPGLRGVAGELAAGETFRFSAFLAVDPSGGIAVRIPVPEIGQGVRTSLAMLVAEELEAPWERIRVEQADAADDLGPHPRAAGSRSVRAYWLPLRQAGAAAREALIGAAAERWGVDPAECSAQEGRIQHRPSGRQVRYGEVAAAAAGRALPADPRLKDPADFRLIGRSVLHIDTPAITRGSVRFGLDTRVPGMLHAVVLRSPVYGGRLRSWDATAAREVRGVRAVVRVASAGDPARPSVSEGLAVVADSTWAAMKGRGALRAEWDEGPFATEGTDRLHARCSELLAAPGTPFREDGDVDGSLRRAARVVEAEYGIPLLAHAPMEPMNCVVHVREDGCEIWAPTQIPVAIRAVVARELGLAPEAVRVHPTRIGGGFGRRLDAGFVLEAIPIARAVGGPVQVVWTREDDLRHGFFRPLSRHRLTAGLDRRGRLLAWRHRQAGTSRYAFRAGADPARSEFLAGTYPAALVPSHRLEYALVASDLPRGPLRGPGYNAFTFAVESFIDEVAHAAGRDPLAFRLDLLGDARELPYDEDDPVFSTARMRRVLEVAAEAAGWGSTPLPPGRGRGIAAGFAFGSYVAHVAEASVDPGTGAIRVHRVTSAIDCGRAVNPNGVRAQVEGAVMDGIGATLHGEITLRDGRVQESNFHDFHLLRLSEAPEVEVHIVGSDLPPTGAGEPPYPPVPAAVANAVFAASGLRVRDLPMRPERVRRGLDRV